MQFEVKFLENHGFPNDVEHFFYRVNPIYPNVPFLYPEKTSDVFWGYSNGTVSYDKNYFSNHGKALKT